MQIFNLLIATISSAMSVVLFVVVLMYYVHLDAKPAMERDLPGLWITALAFGVLGTVAWLTVRAWAKRNRYWPWFETGMVMTGVAVVVVVNAVMR